MTSHTILITGASRGIGRACALALARPETRLVLHYHTREIEAKETATLCQKYGAKTLVVQADISHSIEVNRLFSQAEEHFSPIDILVNNAGIAVYGQLQDITDTEWQNVFATNVNGMFYCTRRALPAMIAKKWGRIINISSMWGQVGASCEVHYSASKAAVIGFTKALAKEVGLSGINVNCIAPGVIDTDMNACYSEDVMQELRDETPLGRTGKPEDIAETVAFLAGDGARYITGQVLCVDGGMAI